MRTVLLIIVLELVDDAARQDANMFIPTLPLPAQIHILHVTSFALATVLTINT